MLLPEHKLPEIDFYSFEPRQSHTAFSLAHWEFGSTYRSVVIVYWRKAWYEFWKPRKSVFKSNCYTNYDVQKNITYFDTNEEIVELKEQLKSWSKNSKMILENHLLTHLTQKNNSNTQKSKEIL